MFFPCIPFLQCFLNTCTYPSYDDFSIITPCLMLSPLDLFFSLYLHVPSLQYIYFLQTYPLSNVFSKHTLSPMFSPKHTFSSMLPPNIPSLKCFNVFSKHSLSSTFSTYIFFLMFPSYILSLPCLLQTYSLSNVFFKHTITYVFSKHTLSKMFLQTYPLFNVFSIQTLSTVFLQTSKHTLSCMCSPNIPWGGPPLPVLTHMLHTLSLSHVFYLHTLSLMFSLNIPSLPWFFSKHTLSLQCFLQPFPLSYVFSIHFPSPMLSTCIYLPNLRSVSTSLSLLSCSTSRGLLTINIF